MRKKQKPILLASLLGVFSLLFFAYASSEAASTKTITLNFNKLGPTVQRGSQVPAEYLAKEIEKRTNGRVKVALFPGSTLASPEETFDATVKGICDIGESLIGYIQGRFPVTEACDLPLGYPSSLVEAHVFTDFYDHFKPKEWDEVVPVYWAGPPPAVIGTVKKPVRTYEDLQGLTIRAHAGSAALIKSLGGVPRVMPITQSYEALAKSVVDGIIVPFEAYVPFKFSEVIKYVTDTTCVAYGSVSFTIMNKNAWNKISPEDQKIIRGVAYDTMVLRGKVWDEDDMKGKEIFLASPGREFITLSPGDIEKFKAAAQTTIDDWIKKKTDQGYPAADYVNYLKERIAYWGAQKP